MEERWRKGVWLGKRFGTEEHIVGMECGSVARSAAVKTHPSKPWDRTFFDGIRGAPWDPSGSGTDESREEVREIPGDIPRLRPREHTEESHIAQSRRVLINRSYLERWGYTLECPKCQAIANRDETQPGLAHSAQCRDRIEELMREDPLLRKRVENADRRREEFLARKIEEA